MVARQEERIAIEVPAQWRMRNSEVSKDLIVKLVLPDQQLVNAREKRARFSALNDAMIVSAADRDRLADAELRQVLPAPSPDTRPDIRSRRSR